MHRELFRRNSARQPSFARLARVRGVSDPRLDRGYPCGPIDRGWNHRSGRVKILEKNFLSAAVWQRFPVSTSLWRPLPCCPMAEAEAEAEEAVAVGRQAAGRRATFVLAAASPNSSGRCHRCGPDRGRRPR